LGSELGEAQLGNRPRVELDVSGRVIITMIPVEFRLGGGYHQATDEDVNAMADPPIYICQLSNPTSFDCE
jgi:hypothetical protein